MMAAAAFVVMMLCLAYLWWEVRHAPQAPADPRLIPRWTEHLSCGECFWLHPAMWTSAKDPFPANLPDQLIISAYCEVHNTFQYKRWKEKHLDDKGLHKPWETDVDNYRGFLE